MSGQLPSMKGDPTVHRLTQPREETIDVRVSGVVDKNVGMTILCQAKGLEYPFHHDKSVSCYEPRTSPRATFSGLTLQAISCTELISCCSNKSRHRVPGGDLLILLRYLALPD